MLFNHHSTALNRGFASVAETGAIIEKLDSMYLLSENLVQKSSSYNFSGSSNTYHVNTSACDSLQKKADYLRNFVWWDSGLSRDAEILHQKITQLIVLSGDTLQSATASANVVSISTGKQMLTLNNTITQELQLIITQQTRLLTARRASFRRTVEKTERFFVLSNILMLIILLGSFLLIFYHFRKRQKTERKLLESQNRFLTLINGTKDLAIFTIDKEGTILDWYEGAHKIKGYSTEEVVGKNISMFYLREEVANDEPQHNLQLAAECGSFKTESWRVRKDGSIFWADVLITAIYDDIGNVKGFTKVTRDFTLHKDAEEKSRRALEKEIELNQIKSSFVSMASHEFRTPLSTILSSVSLIEFYKTTETQDKRDKHIHRIKSAVNEMVATLEEFLSLEKIEEGKVQVKNEIFNIRQLAEDVRLKFNPELKNGQTIEYSHIGSEDVCLDGNYLNHILTNLLSNAIKYSPENSSVLLCTAVENGTTTLSIKDNGIGISTDDQKHLFERFFRASNAGSIKGTGLGLHIVKRFVELLGGTITVKSEISNGTEFTVVLTNQFIQSGH